MLQMEKDNTEEEERAEESGEEANVPLGGDRDSGDYQKYADEVSSDGPSRRPGRYGRKSAEVVPLQEVLCAEGGDADGEEDTAEMAEEDQRVFGIR